MKVILSSVKTHAVALETIHEIAEVVKATLGPGGNPIILQQQGQNPDGSPRTPVITKDGVTVAEHIQYRSQAKNTIAQAIIQIARNTVNQAGDGTTTAIVLAEAMFKAGFTHLKQGANGIQLYEDLKKVKNQILALIDTYKTDLQPEDLMKVALVSANGDEDAASKVTKALEAVGEDGHVSLEDGFSRDTTVEIVEGAMYKQGWRKFGALGSLMVNDKVKNVCELQNAAVVLYAGEIKEAQEISNLVAKIMQMDDNAIPQRLVPILFVAYDFGDEVKNHVIQLRVQGKLPVAAIKAPFDGSPNARTQMLEDLAVLLGGQVTARGIVDLKDITDAHLGSAETIRIGAEETVFIHGKGSETEILQRVDDLKKQMETVMYDFDKENLRLRVGKLTGGVAVVKVGGDSELEMKERKDRIEDALCAVRVAITDGILPGGGITLYKIANELEGSDIATQIMKVALQAPIRQLILNAGKEPAKVLTEMSYAGSNLGYDARGDRYINMFEAGIVDPVKVTKSALENAVSIVGLLLTTGGAIVVDMESKDGLPNPFAGLIG